MKRVYSVNDIVLSVDGDLLPVFTEIQFAAPPPPRENQLRFCSLDDGVPARVAGMLAARARLGPAWTLGLVTVNVSRTIGPVDVAVTVSVEARERITGDKAYINRQAVWPANLGDAALLSALADVLEDIAVHEARESIFVDGALLRDPHTNEFTLTISAPVGAKE